jgi:hypothetical protein
MQREVNCDSPVWFVMMAVNSNLEMWKEATVPCFTALQVRFLRAFEKP